MSQTLDERYGNARRRGVDRRVAWSVAIVAVLSGLAVLLFGGWWGTARVEFQDIGNRVVSDRQIDASFRVSTPANTPTVCAVEALNTSKGSVGLKIVELPVGEQRDHTVRTSLVTTNRATAAHVKSCWVLE